MEATASTSVLLAAETGKVTASYSGKNVKKTTKAALVAEYGSELSIEEVTLRDLLPGEVLIRMEAAAVCLTDTFAADGSFTMSKPPFITGHSGVGIVEQVGDGVRRVRPGQRVAITGSVECGSCYQCLHGSPSVCEELIAGVEAPRYIMTTSKGGRVTSDAGTAGTYAERTIYREISLVPIDSTSPPEHLALLGCGIMSGVGAVLRLSGIQAGDRVVVVGCGQLGLWMIQAARVAGAGHIIAIDPISERREIASGLGADILIDPVKDDATERVRELTGGRGADIVFEAAGSAEVIAQAFTMARNGGTLVVSSVESIDAELTMNAFGVAAFAKRIISSQGGSGYLRRDVPQYAAMLDSGALDASKIVTATVPLDRLNEAFAAARERTALTTVVTFPGA
jgi:S-(hydroxymethyl)glutathione dehydrogenase / alcohol dehydrogenase